MNFLVEELHAPARRNFPRRKYEMRGIFETLQIDLMDMQKYAALNKQFKWILAVIDVFSKKGFLLPLKNKTAAHVAEVFEKQFLIKHQNKPYKIINIHADQGFEFYGSSFKSLMKKYDINLYSTYSNLKASIAERFILSIKQILFKKMSLRGKYKWIDILDEVTIFYNKRFHRTIKMKPDDVNSENADHLLKTVYNYKDYMKNTKPKFRVGDFVRVSKNKNVFDKSFHFNWSPEPFQIKLMHKTAPPTFTLVDGDGQIIQGKFYQQELQRTKHPDIFLIEKILKRKKDKVYVQWLGYKQRSWIDKNDLV